MINQETINALIRELNESGKDPERILSLVQKAKNVTGIDFIPIFEYINEHQRPGESVEDAYVRLFRSPKT